MDFIVDTFKMQIMNRKGKSLSFRTIVCYLLLTNWKVLQDYLINFFKENLFGRFFQNMKAKKIMDSKSIVKLSFKHEENNEIFLELLNKHQCDFKIVNLNNSDKWYASEIDSPVEISPGIHFVLHEDTVVSTDKKENGSNTSNPNDQHAMLRSFIAKKDIYGIVYSYTKTTKELLDFLHANYKKEIQQEPQTEELKQSIVKIFRLTDFTDKGTPLVEIKEVSINKTFDNIFLDLDTKTKLFSAVGNFLDDEYYHTRGLPQNLGILLHGIPGCGKTSLIKALARYLKRTVIIIDFKNIKKVKQLYALFDGVFKTKDDTSHYLTIQETIFVFEDFDCMSNVFKSRKEGDDNSEPDSDLEESLSMMLQDEFGFKEGKDKGKGEEKKDDKEDREAPFDRRLEMIKHFRSMKSDITLNNILELLDDVIEMQKRVIVMTTNKYNEIDSALIRPGRIDLDLEFKAPETLMIYNIFMFMYQQHDKSVLEEIILRYHADCKQINYSTSKIINCFMQQNPEHGMMELLGISLKEKKENKENEGIIEIDHLISDINSFTKAIKDVKQPVIKGKCLGTKSDYLLNLAKCVILLNMGKSITGAVFFSFNTIKRVKVTKIINKRTTENITEYIGVGYSVTMSGLYNCYMFFNKLVKDCYSMGDMLIYIDTEL